MKKRILSLLLAAGMLLTLLVGCNTNEEKNSSAGKASSDNSSVSADEENSGEKSVLKVMAPLGTNLYIKFTDRDEYAVWHELEALFEEYNLSLEFEVISLDQYTTVLQTRTASGTDLPDFLNVSAIDDASIIRMANQGLFLPVNEIIEKYSDGTAKEFFSTGKGQYSNMLNTTEDGKVYWLSQIGESTYNGELASTSTLVNVRRDWLEKAGLEVPKTADEFYQMLKTFQEKDMNGNGTADEVLTFNPGWWSNGIAQWFGLVGDTYSFVIEEGVVTSPWYQEGIKEYFKFLKKLADENLMDTTLIGLQTEEQLNQRIAENKSSALSTYTMATWYEPSVNDPNAEYLPIAALKGTDDITPLIAIEPSMMSYGRWAFTNTLKDEKAAAALIDVLCSEKYMELTQWGIEGDTFEVIDGQNKLLDIAKNASWEEAGKQRKSVGDTLWANGSIFPKRRFVPMEGDIDMAPDYKAEVQREIIDYSPTTPMGASSSYIPVMTQEEIDRINELAADLTTRASELIAQLIIGQAEIDDMDQHVAELDALGLKEIVEIYQNSLNRNENYSK